MTLPVIALVPLATAFGAVATRGFRALGARLDVVSRPDPFVAQHTRSLPRLGGVALAVAAAATLALDTRGANVTAAMLVGALLFLGTGLLDDVRGLRAAPKLALQVASASVAAALGLALPVSGNGVVDAAAGVLWVVVVVNAVNLTDVCDGLVAGLAAIALLVLGATEPALRPVAFAVAGACLGFLFFNAPPATIFLGDAGSHFLGFVLGAVALGAARDQDDLSQLVANGLVVGVPLFELAFVAVVRVHRGASWWLGSADHFSLRLQAAGLSRWETDAVAWAGAGALAVMGWTFMQLEAVGRLLLIVCVFVALVAAGRVLVRWDATPSLMRTTIRKRPA